MIISLACTIHEFDVVSEAQSRTLWQGNRAKNVFGILIARRGTEKE
jgi:hypothetical protein